MSEKRTMFATNEELKALRERNEKRLIEAKEKLGTKWLLHPANFTKKKVN